MFRSFFLFFFSFSLRSYAEAVLSRTHYTKHAAGLSFKRTVFQNGGLNEDLSRGVVLQGVRAEAGGVGERGGAGGGGGGPQAGWFFRRSHLSTAIFITGSAEPLNSRGGRESAKRSCNALDANGQCGK